MIEFNGYSIIINPSMSLQQCRSQHDAYTPVKKS